MNRRSNAALYGKGVFTTIAVRGGHPMLLEKHIDRLWFDAARIGIDLSHTGDGDLRQKINAAAGRAKDGRLRVTIFDETNDERWGGDGTPQLSMEIIAGDRRPQSALRLAVSPYAVNTSSPLAGIKSCNYLEGLLALEEARVRGYDEAVRLNEKGEITAACLANIFWRSEGRLYTPSLQTGCLAGTTRELLLETVSAAEVEAGTEALERAEAIYLTSAGLGIVAVAEFNGRPLDHKDLPAELF